MDEKVVRDRVFGRSLAKEVVNLATEQFPGASQEMQISFWSTVNIWAKEALEALGVKEEQKKPQIVPLTGAEAKKFEKRKVPFGKYIGLTVDQVMQEAPDYLTWLADNESDGDVFKRELIRYLKTPSIKVELDNSDEGEWDSDIPF